MGHNWTDNRKLTGCLLYSLCENLVKSIEVLMFKMWHKICLTEYWSVGYLGMPKYVFFLLLMTAWQPLKTYVKTEYHIFSGSLDISRNLRGGSPALALNLWIQFLGELQPHLAWRDCRCPHLWLWTPASFHLCLKYLLHPLNTQFTGAGRAFCYHFCYLGHNPKDATTSQNCVTS